MKFLCMALLVASSACVEVADNDVGGPGGPAGGKADGDGHYILIGEQDTWLKKTTAQSSELELASEKCSLYAGSWVEVQVAPEREGNHLLVNTREIIPGCGFSRGYVFADHVAESSAGLGGGTCHADVSARVCAFLGTIAYAEGTDDRYDLIFGYQTFSSYADHPRRLVCSGALCSDAAGRYQFLSTTWDGIARRLGVPDFSPASQDRGALELIRGRGVYNLDAIDTYGEFSDAVYKLNREWASLPGSPYGQPTHPMSELWARFQAALGQ